MSMSLIVVDLTPILHREKEKYQLLSFFFLLFLFSELRDSWKWYKQTKNQFFVKEAPIQLIFDLLQQTSNTGSWMIRMLIASLNLILLNMQTISIEPHPIIYVADGYWCYRLMDSTFTLMGVLWSRKPFYPYRFVDKNLQSMLWLGFDYSGYQKIRTSKDKIYLTRFHLILVRFNHLTF